VHKLLAVAGFIVLGLSPSFLDWKENPEERSKIVTYYAVAAALIFVGLDGWMR
jgi:hypothetical protein